MDVLVVMHDPHTHTGASSAMYELISDLHTKNNIRITVCLPNYDCPETVSYLDSLKIPYIKKSYFSNRVINKSLLTWPFLKSIVKFIITIISAIIFSYQARSFQLIYSNTTDNYFGLITAICSGRPHICHIREFGLADQGARQIIGDKIYYKLLINYSIYLVCISQSLKSHIDSQDTKANLKTVLVYDFIIFKKFNYSKRSYTELNFMIVGSINEGKGQKFIIDGVNELKKRGLKTKLAIYGDANKPYGQNLKRYVDNLELTNEVEFKGFSDKIYQKRDACDYAIVASSCEAFGRVTVEAMYAKQIVIATNTGANSELISNEVNGFLFRYNDLESFVDCIMKIQSCNRCEIEKISENGRNSVQRFCGHTAQADVMKLIQEAIT